LNLAGTQFPAFAPYLDRVAYEIYVSGCDRRCPACHSPELQDFSFGEKLDKAQLLKKMKEVRELFDIVSILGGDLLCQNEHEARQFVIWLKNSFPNKEFWLFTGADLREVPDWAKEMFHVIKTGKYISELFQEGFPASTNQKLLHKGDDY
jgi:anaerobic ribonucleoside-triphosphate reductase activating protein